MVKKFSVASLSIILALLLSFSIVVPVSAAVAKPKLTVSDIDYDSMLVKWNTLSDANARVEVQYKQAKASTYETAGKGSSSVYLEDLTPGTLYYIRGRVISSNGTKGSWCTAIKATTETPIAMKNVPTLRTSEVASSSVSFLWDLPSGDLNMKTEVAYSTSKSGTYTTVYNNSGTRCTVEELNHSTTYYFKARFIESDTYKGSWSSPVSVKTAVPSVLSKNLSVTQSRADDTSITIQVNNVDADNSEYAEIEWSSDNSSWRAISKRVTSTVTISDLKPGTTYYVRGRLIYDDYYDKYQGKYTESVQMTTAPLNAVNLRQTGVTTNSITLTWTKSVGATSYDVYRLNRSGDETFLGNTTSNTYTVTRDLNNNNECAYDFFVKSVRQVGSFKAVSDGDFNVGYSVLQAADVKLIPKIAKKPSLVRYYNPTTGKIQFSVSSIPYASRYEWQVRDANNKVLDSGTMSAATKISYKFPKNGFGRIYVRGYVTVGGKRYCGSWSAGLYCSNGLTVSTKWNNNHKATIKWNYTGATKGFDIYVSKSKGIKGVLVKSQTGKSYTLTKYKGSTVDKTKGDYYVTVVAKRLDGSGKLVHSCSTVSDASLKVQTHIK